MEQKREESRQLSGEYWRLKLAELRRRYEVDRTPERKSEYLVWLKQFADVVVRGKDF